MKYIFQISAVRTGVCACSRTLRPCQLTAITSAFRSRLTSCSRSIWDSILSSGFNNVQKRFTGRRKEKALGYKLIEF